MAKKWAVLAERVRALEAAIAGLVSGKKPSTKKAKRKKTNKAKKPAKAAAAKKRTATKAKAKKPVKAVKKRASKKSPLPPAPMKAKKAPRKVKNVRISPPSNDRIVSSGEPLLATPLASE